MTRTQIQLPDDVYARARKVCKSREISLAELARRGLEYILSVYAAEPGATGEWQPPKPRRLGWKGLSDAEIKEQAQLASTEAAFTRRGKK
ncbi:MAG: antitoxin [Verrucomicrobiales bacterium]